MTKVSDPGGSSQLILHKYEITNEAGLTVQLLLDINVHVTDHFMTPPSCKAHLYMIKDNERPLEIKTEALSSSCL